MTMSKPRVPKLWPNGATVAILASGPSLTREDADYARARVPVITVNTAFKMAPDCVAVMASDAKWWGWYKGLPNYTGLKFCLEVYAKKFTGVQVLRNTGSMGLETSSTGLKNGRNSGYAAINLAFHFGATRILLLGYDMSRGPSGEEHFHGEHPNRSRSPYESFVRHYDTIVEPLKQAGVEVINCSRHTALSCFPRMTIEDALAEVPAEAVA